MGTRELFHCLHLYTASCFFFRLRAGKKLQHEKINPTVEAGDETTTV